MPLLGHDKAPFIGSHWVSLNLIGYKEALKAKLINKQRGGLMLCRWLREFLQAYLHGLSLSVSTHRGGDEAKKSERDDREEPELEASVAFRI